ncbi:MAG: molybdopterin-dependent oxidoreductase [Bacteroidetes bacterium]|nr:molybdopterin-dependent oxidoreductase [Bacteroidota bacterium]
MKYTKMIAATLAIVFACWACNNSEKADQIANGKKAQQAAFNTWKEGKEAGMVPIPAGDSIKYISKQVTVTGEVEFPLTLTVDSLKKMNVATIENFQVVCQSGANMKNDKTCKGVLLKEILEKAKIKQDNHKDRNFYIVARATDNYKATFSWAEIFNNPTGQNVYVLFEENGIPIQLQGAMILISRNDIKTGPRHVIWLKSIEVNKVI